MFESIMVSLIVGYFVIGLVSNAIFPAFITANDELNKEYNDDIR